MEYNDNDMNLFAVQTGKRPDLFTRYTGLLITKKASKLSLLYDTWLSAVLAGTATTKGPDGTDWWLKHYGKLPDYYVMRQEAKKKGWNPYKGNLGEVLPGKMLIGGVYKNIGEILPSAPGRIWYEADLNYYGGYRNGDRVLFSNDGLIFITVDHYENFAEVV